MDLLLVRDTFNEHETLGKLFVDGEFLCDVLEDADRKLDEGGTKIKGVTAIPAGTYDVTIDMSTRFKREMPHILDVPGFEGVRIHTGNTDEDTEGCLIVGTRYGHCVTKSRDAFSELWPRLQAAIGAGENVSLTVERGEE